MPAPVRAPKKTISIANDAIFATNEIQPTAPVVVRPPGSSDTGQFLERFTEVIMFGVAMLAIWIGLLSIAFADDVGEEKFLILFIGGLLSSAIALFMVELQAKKNDNHLMISQNYLLGLSFFFMAVGSQANVGGAASAPVVASAFHPSLAPVGVLLAVMGYARAPPVERLFLRVTLGGILLPRE